MMNFRNDKRFDRIPPVPSRGCEILVAVLTARVQQLIERIDEVEERLRAFSPAGRPGDDSAGAPDEVLMAGSLTVDHGARRVFVGEREVELSPTEYRLMFELTRNAGKVVTHRELMRIASGCSGANLTNLKVYVGRLRAKINLAAADESRCEVQPVRVVGYRLVA